MPVSGSFRYHLAQVISLALERVWYLDGRMMARWSPASRRILKRDFHIKSACRILR